MEPCFRCPHLAQIDTASDNVCKDEKRNFIHSFIRGGHKIPNLPKSKKEGPKKCGAKTHRIFAVWDTFTEGQVQKKLGVLSVMLFIIFQPVSPCMVKMEQ